MKYARGQAINFDPGAGFKLGVITAFYGILY